jgi:hypothetical protein
MKLEVASSSPMSPGKYITFFKTTTDICDIQNMKSSFIRKAITETFKKSSSVKLKCPFEKNVFLMRDWLIEADKMIPNSFAISGDIRIYWEFLINSNSSSKRIVMASLKLLLEIQKHWNLFIYFSVYTYLEKILKIKVSLKHCDWSHIQFCSSYELEAARSSCEQRIFWVPGTAFQNFKNTNFFFI